MLTMAQVTLQVKCKMTFSHDVGHEIDQILNMRAAAQLINAVFWAAPHIYILSTTCGEGFCSGWNEKRLCMQHWFPQRLFLLTQAGSQG